MKYLSSVFVQNGGACVPFIRSYQDSDGNLRASANISIASYKGNIVFNTRITNYMYVPMIASDKLMWVQTFGERGKISSHNVIGTINSTPTLYELTGENGFRLNNMSFTGLEDVRLVVWNDILYGIGFRPDVIDGMVIPQLIEYNDDLTIKRSWFLKTNKTMEKNWQPIEDRPFTFMYDPDKSYLVTLNIDELQVADDPNNPTIINEIETPDFTGVLSGSTQLIRLDDGGYVSICHTGHRYTGKDFYEHWVYNHYFVVYDKNLNVIWISQPFRFVTDCIEYTCGMCRDNGNIYISFSMYDGINHLLSIPIDKFQNILTCMANDPSGYEGMPNNEYMLQCYTYNNITGPIALVYMMYLENAHMLDNMDKFNELLSLPLFHDTHNAAGNGMLLYFITRRTDSAFLLKELTK